MDETMVTTYPILNIDEPPAQANMIRYPLAGEKSHHVTVGIFDLRTRKTIFLQTGEPADQYLTNIAWSPDEKSIYVVVLNRAQDHLKLNRYNAATGAFEATLFEEKDPKYVQPLNPMAFTADGSKFIWQSRSDGYNHLYLFETNGKPVKQLTKGNWEVTSYLGLNPSHTKAFYISTAEKAIDRDIYSVELSSGKITRISKGEGVHKAMVSPTGKYVIDEYSGRKGCKRTAPIQESAQ
jgi:dipeptidyl-peptidase 4